MEKRLVLSFVLSFLVLYVWATLAPKPPKIAPPPTSSDSILSDSEALAPQSNISTPQVELESPANEELYFLENEKLLLKFSSTGGSLVNIALKEYDEELPVKHIGGFEQYAQQSFSPSRQESNLIEFTLSNDSMLIQRTYSLDPDAYTLNVRDHIISQAEMSKNVRLDIMGFTLNMSEPTTGAEEISKKATGIAQKRDRGLNEYAISSAEGIKRKNNAYKFDPKEEKSLESPVNWLAFRNRYYATIIKPDFETQGYATKVLGEKMLQIRLDSANLQFNPGEEKEFGYTVFIGPEKTDILKEYGADFEDIKRYYKLGLFDGIAKIIGGFMKILYSFIPNWGVCIILVSVTIYYSMYPLTAKGMSSMKRMQSLQPKIQQLKERHEDNPQKLNQEMLELYRKEKINPLGGCLPMLLQMPVFIGLYQVLWRNVDFKGAHFLWIKDLSQPDRLFVMDMNLPIIGSDINLLPLLMMVIMFVQQKFSAKNMTVTDPMQLQQQKMMATVMPLLLGFIFYKFASGLTLYFTMFYLFSTLTQWKISKEPKVATS